MKISRFRVEAKIRRKKLVLKKYLGNAQRLILRLSVLFHYKVFVSNSTDLFGNKVFVWIESKPCIILFSKHI